MRWVIAGTFPQLPKPIKLQREALLYGHILEVKEQETASRWGTVRCKFCRVQVVYTSENTRWRTDASINPCPKAQGDLWPIHTSSS